MPSQDINMRQLILDTETTGLDPLQGHRIIEIALLELVNRKLTNQYLHHYINPNRSIEATAVKIHGLTEKFLSDKPVFVDVAHSLLDYLSGAQLIIHNAPFDLAFLNYELQLINPESPPIQSICSVIDTLVLARQKHPGQQNNLDALCKRYNIDTSHRKQHGALVDTRLLAHVYLAMTGGQAALFEAEAKAEKPISSRPTEIRVPLRVVHANEQELEEHARYLLQLKEKTELTSWE